MKLPNIQYKQRKPLARIDPSMYVALGRAQAQAAEAIGSAGKAVGDVVQGVYDRESVSQMQDGYLNYSEKMDEYQQQQKSQTQNEDTGESEGSWINGTQRYDNYERDLRDTISKKLSSPLARRLFADKVSVQNVQNKKVNNAQLGKWQKEHEIAGVHTRLNRQVDNKKFDDARATVIEARTVDTIGELEAAKQLIAINYEEKNHNYSVGVDLIVTPQDAINYRKEVEVSGLKGPDINRHLGAVDDNLINNFQAKMNNVILEAENVNGSKVEGYNAGRTYLDSVMRTKADKLGGDNKFKEMVVSTSNTILNRYKGAVEKQTVEGKRIKRMNDLEAGFIKAGPDYNEVAYADIFNKKYMNYQVDGKTGYRKDFRNPDPTQRAVTDKEFLDNDKGVMNRFVDYSADGGHMPNTGRATIRAALTHGDSEQGVQAVAGINALWRKNPFAVYRNGENDDFADIAVYSEMMGGTEDTNQNALNLWRKTNSMSKEMRDGFVGGRKENDEFFDDNIDTSLDKQFGQKDTAFYNFWSNTTPVMRQDFKVRARKLMDKYLPAYEGGRAQALNAALLSLKGSYGATGVNGEFSIMRNSPNDAVVNGNKNGGEWLRQQLEADVKENFGEDIDMDGVYIEAVERFNANDPAYQVYQKTDDGMVRSLGVTKFDYTVSKEYLDNQAELTKEQEANKRIAHVARLREEWELENPPETRERTKMGIEVNPYGKGSEQGVFGKALTGQARGTRAMAEQAKRAKAITAPMKEKRLKEEKEQQALAAQRYQGQRGFK